MFVFGFYRGYEHEKKVLDATVAEYKAQQEIAEAHNKEIVKQQQSVSEGITKEYANAVDNIKAYYAKHPFVRLQPSGQTCSIVPTTGESAGASNGTSSSDLSSTQGDAPADVSVIFDDCAADVQKLMFLQEWQRDQEGIK